MLLKKSKQFRRRYMMNGSTVIVITNNGALPVIYIECKAGLGIYEFATGFGFIETGARYYTGTLFTTVDKSNVNGVEVLAGFGYKGRKLNESDLAAETARDYWVSNGNYDDQFLPGTSGPKIPSYDVWFYIEQTDNEAIKQDRQINGYRDTVRGAHNRRHDRSHLSQFYYSRFGLIYYFWFSQTFLLRPSRKPKLIDALVPNALPVSTKFVDSDGSIQDQPASFAAMSGATALPKNSISITSSISGYDHQFEVVSGSQKINIAAPIPIWVEGEIYTQWFFSPDGLKAVSVQYQGNLVEGADAGEPKMGISEIVFNPYIDEDGDLQCDFAAGYTLEPGTQVLAVSYDMYDASIMRVAIIKNYLSEWYVHGASPPSSIRAILGVLELSTIDAGVISPAYDKVFLYHGPFCRGGPSETGVTDEYGYGVTGLTNTQSSSWEAAYQYDWTQTTIQSLDMRASAVAFTTYMQKRDGATLADRQFWHKEHRIWGQTKESLDHATNGAFPQAVPVIDPVVPAGYTPYGPGHSLWVVDFAWDARAITGSSRAALGLQHSVFGSLRANDNSFRLHPNKSYALMGTEDFFDFAYLYFQGAFLGGVLPVAPPGFIHDHIETVGADGTVLTSTHLGIYNDSHGTAYSYSSEDFHLGFAGIWII